MNSAQLIKQSIKLIISVFFKNLNVYPLSDFGAWFVCSESPTEFTGRFSQWSEWSCCKDEFDWSTRQRTCLSTSSDIPAACDGKDFVVANCKCFIQTTTFTPTSIITTTGLFITFKIFKSKCKNIS
jgi:hypothetical protein